MSKTAIALSVSAAATAEARRVVEQVASEVDLVELRLDTMQEWNLSELLGDRPCPVIVTCRPVWEGGFYKGDEGARLRALLEAAELGAEHIDSELDAADFFHGKGLGRTRLIVSKHDFETMPDMDFLHRRCCDAGADIAKVVGTAATVTDSLEPLRLLRDSTVPTIALAMGSQGVVSRILALKYGAYLTYVSLGVGRELAPGQISLEALRDVYRAEGINRDTTVYGHLTPGRCDEKELAVWNNALSDASRNERVVPLVIQSEDPLSIMEAYAGFGFNGFVIHPQFSRSAEEFLLAHGGSCHGRGSLTLLLQRGEGWVASRADESVDEVLRRFLEGP